MALRIQVSLTLLSIQSLTALGSDVCWRPILPAAAMILLQPRDQYRTQNCVSCRTCPSRREAFMCIVELIRVFFWNGIMEAAVVI
jgi:hypothetical protein